ncbi:hypothetical protein BJ138DRAFT_1106305 [Hygrophoropsis aurantiaca]|uniref:Uncharacterized protein n=1 Tax=Hygrophoropsis aurantiaca TaxID=72124 RepID=A0ACB7ZV45_9AGAM|nr:hypothetical protein BJ138DRAFT_1106305 [Hygrophoropsis aurantiaca]
MMLSRMLAIWCYLGVVTVTAAPALQSLNAGLGQTRGLGDGLDFPPPPQGVNGTINEIAGALPSTTSDGAPLRLRDLASTVAGVANGVVEGAEGAASNAVGTAAGVANGVIEGAEGAAGDAAGTAAGVANGVVEGAEGAASNAVGTAAGVANGVIEGAEGAAGDAAGTADTAGTGGVTGVL